MRNLIFAALLGFSFSIFASDDVWNSSLEDLLNLKTAVTTKKEVSARSSPGILSIITEEEIRAMGARDLIDVLQLVPSIAFGTDVEGVVGIGIRGMWAHEGKFLLLIDGIEMNEIQFGTTHFGNEFPVNQIKRIEVVRGPGSVVYGGYAELAVVNVITKKGADLKGASVDATYGRMKSADGRENLGLAFGNTAGRWDYSASGYLGRGKRGDGTYTGFTSPDSGSFNMADADNLKPGMVNVGATNGDFNFRFLHEDYRATTRSMYGFTAIDADIPIRFRSYNALMSYDFHIGDKLKITPVVQLNRQIPWEQTSDEARVSVKTYKIESERLRSGVNASYDVTERLNLLAGFEYTSDKNHIVEQRDAADTHFPFKTGSDDANFDNRATLAQVLYHDGAWTGVLGARYENPSFTKESFVPRLGITRAEKNWHAKVLYAQAFRTPTVQNVNSAVAQPIKPEKTTTSEIEFGHSLSSTSYITGNVFVTTIKNPIVYYYDTDDRYDNFGEVGTSGAELDYRWKKSWGQVQAGYAYYAINHNNVEKYSVPGKADPLVGLPQSKAVLNGFFETGFYGWRVNPGLIYFGEIYGYEYDANTNAMEVRKSGGRIVTNLFLSNVNLGVPGLQLGAGVFNLFDTNVRYAQPYNGGHSPIPGPSREFVIRVDYSIQI